MLGRQTELQGNTPILHFHTPINVGDFEVARIPLSKTVGICGIKCCIMHLVFIHDLEIKLVYIFELALMDK